MQRIIGESSTLTETLDHVSRVAALNRPILIIGERGSGKEMIAERLHFLSKRWDESFHKVNCAAISEQLLDSELFGHEAGAFTGASKMQMGRFERADGGTLFLDELGTMPLRIQEKLLRIIEYGEFERLGGQETLKVDIRIVAATNADLPKLADKGKFRHDLLDRLAFDVINVPPLRERIDDIPTLVDHFATRMCLELEREYYSGFSQQALSELTNHRWPGNIRELKNVVERSICHWHDPDTPVEEVIINPFKSNENSSLPSNKEDIQTPSIMQATDEVCINFHDQIKNMELELLKRALTVCKNHQKQTASYLGMSYHQLRALLKKYKDEI
ncbi:phage shock protein operon transcriptional activator [Agarilytica rhodophyticola]|uniref:phage shock protein operon transcriptional activator n=1 Tax=Agarilytica rhodophyticola TaxID=1737490 RepID=UPI000B34A086|nr:phage shock protein operon transcriptional activator [Agarilytica rhodophyticola]